MSNSREANAPPEIVHCSVNGNENYYAATLKYQTEDPAEDDIHIKVEPDSVFGECDVNGGGTQITADDNFSYGNIPIYICDRCNKIFERKNRLKAHMRLHFPRWHVCRYCGKRFWKRSNLVYHERIHLGERPYSCSSCYKTFMHKSDLIKHEGTHVNLLALRSQSVSSNLGPPIVIDISDEEVYECSSPKETFNRKKNLHEQIRTYNRKNEQIHEVSPAFANSVVKQENVYLGEIYEHKCDINSMNVKPDPLTEIHKTEIVDVDVLPLDEEIDIKYEYIPEEEGSIETGYK